MVNGRAPALSQAAIGRALGLSPAAMTKLKKQGMPVDSVESARAWRSRTQNIAQRKPEREIERDPPDFDDMPTESRDAARTRREIAEANLAELKVREASGRLVDAAVVRAEFAKTIAAIREGLLALPARMGPVLAAAADARRVQTLLDTEIRAALGDMVGRV